LFVYEIEVLPEFRRSGIGRQLMTSVVAAAAREGADTFLLTNRSNVAATALYRSVGGQIESGDEQMFEFRA
jgi:ribosomal protein S18 acetylase RimI-like enzyme